MTALALAFDGPEDGARAMARDEVLVGSLAGSDDAEFLLRAHGWLHPTLSIGRAQPLPPGLAEDAQALGVELVRRPTGGGWLLHLPGDLALTLAVKGPLGVGGFRRAARVTAQGIASGMAACGVPALVFTASQPPATRADVCFMRADPDEVTVGDTKVAGVALARFGRAALVQTALPLVREPRELHAFADRWDPRRAAAAHASAGVDRERLWRTAADALAALLGARCEPWHWPGTVLKRAEVRRRHYQDAAFTLHRRPLPDEGEGA